MTKSKSRLSTEGSDQLSMDNPFGGLDSLGALPPAQPSSIASPPKATQPPPAQRSRGRVELRRLKAGKGGKTVTEIKGFQGIGSSELEKLAAELKRSCGVGGTYKDRIIEIQGDHRETVASMLKERGYLPVMCGG